MILELAEEIDSPAKIGLILRDKHGIPKSKLISRKITEILKEKNINHKEEKNHIEESIEKIKSHFQKNKHDYSAQRAMAKKLWTIQKLGNTAAP